MNQHTFTTATNHTTPSLTVEGMKRMMEEIRSLPVNDQWMLIDPQGKAYIGTVQQALPVLMRAHPLFDAGMVEIGAPPMKPHSYWSVSP